MCKIFMDNIFHKIISKRIYEKTFQSVYIVDFTLLEDEPIFKNEFKSIETWYIYSGKRWMCHTEISTEEFKKIIIKHVKSKDIDKVKFYLDYLPFSINTEILF